jgi:Holliday junction resolvase RusA-like endonuclease
MICFTVPGVPVAQPRQRVRVAKIKGKFLAMNYTPKADPVNSFKAACKIAAQAAYSGPPLDCPLSVRLEFVFPRLKATKGQGRTSKTTKPDADNLAKSIMDSLNGQLWRDDSIICDLFASKRLAAVDEQPAVFVTVERMP